MIPLCILLLLNYENVLEILQKKYVMNFNFRKQIDKHYSMLNRDNWFADDKNEKSWNLKMSKMTCENSCWALPH